MVFLPSYLEVRG